MELNLRTLSKPLLAGITALFVATPAVSSTGPRLTIQWDNARQDPNISRRLWVNVTWRHGERNLVPTAGDPYVQLKPGASTRHLIWIECDGKPWKTTYGGYTFTWTKYQTQLCNQVFGREIVPDISNRPHYNRTLKACMNWAKTETDRARFITKLNKCFVYNGLNAIPLDMGVAYAI